MFLKYASPKTGGKNEQDISYLFTFSDDDKQKLKAYMDKYNCPIFLYLLCKQPDLKDSEIIVLKYEEYQNVEENRAITNTPSSKLIRNVFFAFAEFERDMIIERTTEGKAIAKQNPDFREGRPKKYKKAQIEHALELLENNSYAQVEQLTGISKSTLIRAKRKLKK